MFVICPMYAYGRCDAKHIYRFNCGTEEWTKQTTHTTVCTMSCTHCTLHTQHVLLELQARHPYTLRFPKTHAISTTHLTNKLTRCFAKQVNSVFKLVFVGQNGLNDLLSKRKQSVPQMPTWFITFSLLTTRFASFDIYIFELFVYGIAFICTSATLQCFWPLVCCWQCSGSAFYFLLHYLPMSAFQKWNAKDLLQMLIGFSSTPCQDHMTIFTLIQIWKLHKVLMYVLQCVVTKQL